MNNKTNKKEKKLKPCGHCFKNNPPFTYTCNYCHKITNAGGFNGNNVDPSDYMDIDEEIQLRKKEESPFYKLIYFITRRYPQHEILTTKEHIQKREKQEKMEQELLQKEAHAALQEHMQKHENKNKNTTNPPIHSQLTLEQIHDLYKSKIINEEKFINHYITHHKKKNNRDLKGYETSREEYIQKIIYPHTFIDDIKNHDDLEFELFCHAIYFSPLILFIIQPQLTYNLWWMNYYVFYGLIFGIIYYYLSIISPLNHMYKTILIPLAYGLLTHDVYSIAIYWTIRMLKLFF